MVLEKKIIDDDLLNTLNNIISDINITHDLSLKIEIKDGDLEEIYSIYSNKNRLNRTGQVEKMSNGMFAEILVYRRTDDIDVRFFDGTIVYHKTYKAFIKGHIGYPNERVGEENVMKSGELATIICYRNTNDIDVMFKDGTIAYNKTYNNFRLGSITNPNKKLNQSNRIGEYNLMNNGLYLTITNLDGRDNWGLQLFQGRWSDGKNTIKPFTYKAFKKGQVAHPNRLPEERLGKKNIMSNGMSAEIITYRNADDIDIKFSDGTIVYHKRYHAFTQGKIAYPKIS